MCQVEQRHRFVVLECSFQQPGAKRRGVRRPGVTEPEAVLDFAKVVGPGVLAVAILSQCLAGNAQLQRQVGDDVVHVLVCILIEQRDVHRIRVVLHNFQRLLDLERAVVTLRVSKRDVEVIERNKCTIHYVSVRLGHCNGNRIFFCSSGAAAAAEPNAVGEQEFRLNGRRIIPAADALEIAGW